MSPRETLASSTKGASTGPAPFALDDYAVTSNGFLPEEAPLKRLPDPYYAPWESLIESLPASLADQTLRQKVDRLPVLSTDRLATEKEWRRACVVLGFLAHAYIWGGDTAAEVLPPPITLPLLAVSHHLGVPPVATYACVNLWNFQTTTGTTDFTNLDALESLHTFTGTRDESWFYVVSVAMEAQGAYIIRVMLDALHALQQHNQALKQTHDYTHTHNHTHNHCNPSQTQDNNDLRMVTAALESLTTTIHTLATLLDRMDEQCNPQVFYHRIRPFLAGSKNMAAAGLPRGVFYDEGDGKGSWRQLRGGSNGQSSLVQFLDLALGVEHASVGGSPDGGRNLKGVGGGVGKGKEVSFHEEVRAYMPEPHRRFLEDVAGRYPGGMRVAVAELVLLSAGGEGEKGLDAEAVPVREAFRTATRALAEFRNRHLQMVTRYIIIPSRQPNGRQEVNLATASSRLGTPSASPGSEAEPAGAELTGTGGTALLPFLKQSRDETFQAGRLPGR